LVACCTATSQLERGETILAAGSSAGAAALFASADTFFGSATLGFQDRFMS